MLWPGDVLTCDGDIVLTAQNDLETLVNLELEARSREATVLTGWATFVVPTSELVPSNP
jgi:hypothetical protein